MTQNIGTKDIYPYLGRVDVKDFAAGEMIFNPGGTEKLLKKVSDDLVSLFVVSVPGKPIIIDRKFLGDYNLSAEVVAEYAEQNMVKLYNQGGKQLERKIDQHSSVYRIFLNDRLEAACMIISNLWTEIEKQLNDHVFVSVPSNKELLYCAVKAGNSLTHLIEESQKAYAQAETRLSPSIYLFHNGRWKCFNKGVEEIYEYCAQHRLITFP